MQYLSKRKHDLSSQPLFSFMDGVPVSRQFFTELWLALSFCNLNLHQYETHSFRIGAATTAADWFVTELQIQHMGRWKSNVFKKYIHIPTLQLWDIYSLWFSFRTLVISQGLDEWLTSLYQLTWAFNAPFSQIFPKFAKYAMFTSIICYM